MNFKLIILTFLSIISNSIQQQQQQCLFNGCKCDGEESNDPIIYEIICDKLSESVFPERGQSQTDTNLISTLEIVSNKIKEIPDDQFHDLEIDLLDLSKNEITTLESKVFRGIVKLEQLDLASNLLETIDSDAFKPLEFSLVQLNLGRNKLGSKSIPNLSLALNKLKNLTVLTLIHNEIAVLPNLSKMIGLKDLSLSTNFIESLIDETTKESLLPSSLIELNLNENRINHLTENSFANLKSLKYLSLESNLINSISDDAFSQSILLSSINLCKNYLNQIPKSFYMLSHLQRLDLSSQNQILRQIDNYAFDRKSSSQSIRRIDLSNNRISKIEEKAFCSRNRSHPFINVKEIDLAANPLSNLNACLARQLATGLKDPSQLKAKLSFKTNQASQIVTDNLKCDCEITKAANLIDFEGDCKNEEGNLVPLKLFKCLSNEESDINIETVCSMTSYNCVQDQNKEDEVQEHKSYSTESTEFNDFNINNKNRINANKMQNDQKQQKNKDNTATKLPASAIVSSSSILQKQLLVIISLVNFTLIVKSSVFTFFNL